jgi:hypothetical protein
MVYIITTRANLDTVKNSNRNSVFHEIVLLLQRKKFHLIHI